MSGAGGVPIVLLTRFSVRSLKFMQAAGIADEARRTTWFRQRAQLFRAITLPSVRAQTRRPDTWLLLFSEGDEAMAAECLGTLDPWITPVFLPSQGGIHEQLDRCIERALGDHEDLLVSRMDSDDALVPDYFERIERAAAELPPGPSPSEVFYLLRRGCRWDGAQQQSVDYPNNPFITAFVRGWRDVRTNPLILNHTTVLTLPHAFVEEAEHPAWLQVLHGANASNDFLPAHGPVVASDAAAVCRRYNLAANALQAIHSMREAWNPSSPPVSPMPITASPAASTPPAARPAAAASAAPLDTKTARPRRLNALGRLVGARSYLEIGVATGATFFAIDAERKVAVDPRFRFDPAEQQDPHSTYHALTSNDYFTGPGFGESFDLMYIDGLHTFEQTLIDFQSSLLMSHGRSVVLIDDTVPNDVFSAVPNQKIAFKYRAKTGNKSLVWHGDVYKLVVYIHDFLPMLSYMTFMSGGNPQTVVWREPRSNVQPVCGDIERIARLDYFWLMENFAVMCGAPEPEVLERVAQWSRSLPAGTRGATRL